MILSFPLVKESGELTGAELSIKLADIYAIEQMTRYAYRSAPITPMSEENPNPDFGSIETFTFIPNCMVIYAGRSDFNVQGDYQTLKIMIKDLNEWDATV